MDKIICFLNVSYARLLYLSIENSYSGVVLLLFRQATILKRLCHPSLIQMLGVGIQPRVIILELAPLGSLGSLLKNGMNLSRGLQHRVILQVSISQGHFACQHVVGSSFSLVRHTVISQFHTSQCPPLHHTLGRFLG